MLTSDDVKAIKGQAAKIRPGAVIVSVLRFLIWNVLMGIPYGVSWVLGRVWYGFMMVLITFRTGYRDGAKVPVKVKEEPKHEEHRPTFNGA